MFTKQSENKEIRKNKKKKYIIGKKHTQSIMGIMVVIVTHNVFKTNEKFHRKQGKKTLR